MTPATPAAPQSREIRVFLSSTFHDFMEERDLLVKQVFPSLRRRAQERGVEVVDVDLRWGITEEESQRGKVIGICLAEIERCRPYFIGMLGERYGWTPRADDYPDEVLEREELQWLKDYQGGVSLTELEILHGVLNDQEMAGRAFFYFRDPAWSRGQSEPGFICDTAEEQAKLLALKDRIRASGFPVAEQLPDPKAIAERIEADLWTLIEAQFPELDPVDALEREERKHASYRQSRLGVYLGQDYVDQLEALVSSGEQAILITGESGSGKSALIANWMERHAQSHPADLVYAHHLGCTNDANDLRPLLGRMLDTASKSLMGAELITEPIQVPQDWWELTAKVAETLQSLGHWCQQQGKRWIWVLDGLDRLDPDEQKALPWLPLNLPAGVQVVASALTCPAREILLKRSYTTLTIQPLEKAEQEQLIQRYLQRYTKELDGGLRQQVLSHPLAGSPLFLKVLLEELRQCGRHDTLKDQLAFYLSSQTVDDLYERVLERLEGDGSGEAVKKVMTTLWASRAGLTEPELLAITDLKPLQWAPIDLALEKAFGRNGNRLVFDHDYLRIAVQDRYLLTEEHRRQAHSDLADWYQARDGWDERDSEELPWQLEQAARLEDLRGLLTTPILLALLCRDIGNTRALSHWKACNTEDEPLDLLINDAVEYEIEKMRDQPDDLIWFADQLADLLDEGGYSRGPAIMLRVLSVELEENSDRPLEVYLEKALRCADSFRLRGFYEQAQNVYEILMEAAASDSLLSLAASNGMALLLIEQGCAQKSLPYIQKSLQGAERLLPQNHPLTIVYRANMALATMELGDYEKAETLYREILASQEAIHGIESEYTLITAANLGILLSRNGNHPEAIALLERCRDSRSRLLGPEHPETILTSNYLAVSHFEAGNAEIAETILIQCMKLQETIAIFNPCTIRTACNLAQIYKEQGLIGKAVEMRRSDVSCFRSLLGEKDCHTLNALNELAIDLRESGSLEEAESLFRELIEERQQVLEPSDFGIGRALGGLAKTLEAAGKLEEAAAYARQALEHRLEHQGPDDFSTNVARLDLARLLHKLGRVAEANTLLDQLETSMESMDEPDDADRQLQEEAAALRSQIQSGP